MYILVTVQTGNVRPLHWSKSDSNCIDKAQNKNSWKFCCFYTSILFNSQCDHLRLRFRQLYWSQEKQFIYSLTRLQKNPKLTGEIVLCQRQQINMRWSIKGKQQASVINTFCHMNDQSSIHFSIHLISKCPHSTDYHHITLYHMLNDSISVHPNLPWRKQFTRHAWLRRDEQEWWQPTGQRVLKRTR